MDDYRFALGQFVQMTADARSRLRRNDRPLPEGKIVIVWPSRSGFADTVRVHFGCGVYEDIDENYLEAIHKPEQLFFEKFEHPEAEPHRFKIGWTVELKWIERSAKRRYIQGQRGKVVAICERQFAYPDKVVVDFDDGYYPEIDERALRRVID